MIFTSVHFIFFLPIVFFLYYLCPLKFQWILILISNYVFYSFAGIQYVLLLAYITVITYLCGKYSRNRFLPTYLQIILLLFPLCVFKYTGFITENVNIILSAVHSSVHLSTMKILLPLGISFYTFSAISYVIDVQQEKYPAFDNLFHLAVGLSFFPIIVCGPIERQGKLVPQILSGHVFDYSKATHGLKQIAWGLFEKVVIADNFSIYVDTVFSDVHSYSGFPLLIGSVCFSIQIYCDFAGYSDMAIGIGKLFGIELTKNFNSPYLSSNLQTFWHNWHISLSNWLRDYIYIPLGGNRKGFFRKQVNTLCTMLISGLWHGAAWTFILWGIFHGLILVVEDLLKIHAPYKKSIIRSFFVIFPICNIFWILFRAASINDIFYILTHMFTGITTPSVYFKSITQLGIGEVAIALAALKIAILFSYDYYSLKCDVIEKITNCNPVVRWCIYLLFILLIAQLSYKGNITKFVYAGF